MKKKVLIIVGLCVAAVLLVVAIMTSSHWLGSSEHAASTSTPIEFKSLADIRRMSTKINYKDYNLNQIIPASEQTGNIPEHVIGDAKAPVLIFEYADYQCSSCAAVNGYLAEIVKDYGDQVAVVYRGYILSYHQNGVAAASAANAAGLQGYWEEYKNILFANQNEWFDYDTKEMQAALERYFISVSDQQGDLDRFRSDMASDAVAQKIAFDWGLGDHLDIGGTPWLYLDGKWIDHENLFMGDYMKKIRGLIDQKLAKK